jgi:hypothetical protein
MVNSRPERRWSAAGTRQVGGRECLEDLGVSGRIWRIWRIRGHLGGSGGSGRIWRIWRIWK